MPTPAPSTQGQARMDDCFSDFCRRVGAGSVINGLAGRFDTPLIGAIAVPVSVGFRGFPNSSNRLLSRFSFWNLIWALVNTFSMAEETYKSERWAFGASFNIW